MYLAVTGLITFLVGVVCVAILLFSRPLNRLKVLWAMICFFGGLWGLGFFITYTATSYEVAYRGLNFCNHMVLFVPLFLLHFSLAFSGEEKRGYRELIASYLLVIGIFAGAIIFPQLFIPRLKHIMNFAYYPVPGPLYHVFMAFCIFAYGRSFFTLFREYQRTVSLRRQQLKYFFLGLGAMFLGAIQTVMPVYDIKIEPIGAFAPPILLGLTTLILSKYYLPDLKVFVLRGFLIVVICGAIPALPFTVGANWMPLWKAWLGELWWAGPLTAAIAMSCGGTLLIRYIFDQEAKGISLVSQKALLRIAFGLGRVKTINGISDLIVRLLVWSLKVNSAALYLYNDGDRVFRLKSWRYRGKDTGTTLRTLAGDSVLGRFVSASASPVVGDEIKLRARDEYDVALKLVGEELDSYGADIILPCRAGKRLPAVIILGAPLVPKAIEPAYLVFLSLLANQLTLAIENASSYDDLRRAQEHLAESEKMVTIGNLAGGLSHQLNNRFTTLLFLSRSLEAVISRACQSPLVDEEQVKARSVFRKMEDNIDSSREVLRGILNYSAENEEYEPFDARHLIESSVELVGFKVRLDEFAFNVDIAEDCPKVVGNFAQLQEVLFNIIDNAYHSMMEKKKLKLVNDYSPAMTVRVRVAGGSIYIAIADNGMGIRPENMRKLFTPFFSTKAMTKKGYGLGLYVMKQIVERNHRGRIELRSEYLKGAEVEIALPVQSGAAASYEAEASLRR
ncbi:MAG: hypothetical protein HQL20_09330 [Candidatus Omnitrophica bacterium]|nr:hypothetical protein [Candidatus Omnitrophota bacterium]